MEKMTGHGVGWEDGTFSCSRPRRMFCVRRNNSVVLRTRRGRGRRRKSAWPLLHYVSGSGTSTSTSFSFWLMRDSVPIRRSPHPAVPPFGQPSPQPVGSQSIAYATGVSTAPREETSVIFRMSPAAYARSLTHLAAGSLVGSQLFFSPWCYCACACKSCLAAKPREKKPLVPSICHSLPRGSVNHNNCHIEAS
ncbi:hypothetical protein F4825DRAFT_304178 [Nemania diffusa]|nr:hypothetical protein F4825DRAFT_304178 [Nemania diffusa]